MPRAWANLPPALHPLPRRACRPQEHLTSGTPSSTARGWRTVSAPRVGAAPQVPGQGSFPTKQGYPWGRRGTGLGTRSHVPTQSVCDVTAPALEDSGQVIVQLRVAGQIGGLVSSGRVSEDDGGWQGRKLRMGLERTGADRPPVPPSPWCLPAASEVAPSCPPPQAPLDHPTQTPASWGTLHVPRSRSSWKHLSSTCPSWYVQPPGAGAEGAVPGRG